MEFFDKIGKKASEAYKVTADKTGKIAKETKIKLKITELKSQINDIYEEIGKKVYEKHIREEEYSIEKELDESCTKIDAITDQINSLLKQCLDLKDKKQCPKCYTEIEKEVKFCPNCGEKQTDEIDATTNESSKSDIVKTVEVESNIEIDENETKEQKDNLEKTIEVEANIEQEDNNTKTDETDYQ